MIRSFGTLKTRILYIYSMHPLGVSLLLAFTLRFIASVMNHGPGAIDDYNNTIGPALKLLQTGEPPQVPSLRFEFLPYLFYYFMLPFQLMGFQGSGELVSGAYILLSIVFLSQVWGMFLWGGVYLNDKWRNLFTLVGSVHFIFSFFMTRAYLGSFSLVAIIWGLYWIKKDKHFLSGLMFSLVALFRFTLAPIYLVGLVYVLRKKIIKPGGTVQAPTRPWMYLLGGLSTTILMVALEHLTGHEPFETVISFFRYNIQAHVVSNSYGSMPWFTYFGILLLVFIPPISIILLKPFFKACQKLKLPFAVFLAVLLPHLFLPYKLERFIVPVIPVFMLITLYGLQISKRSRWYPKVFYIFLWINLPISILFIFSGSQMSATKSLIELEKRPGVKFIHNVRPVWWGYYGYHKPRPQVESQITNIIREVQKKKILSFHILNFLALPERELKKLSEHHIFCQHEETYWPSIGEQIVIWLNPKFNQRRRETVLYHCDHDPL